MILFPAIDLKEGQCVRLRQGDMAQATIFNSNPADQAQHFANNGAEWLHLVDLDGAFAGRSMNAAAVKNILRATRLPCQLGGGIRSLAAIESWFEEGIARVILGTIALRNPALVQEAARRFPNRIAVGIDARDGKVAVEGWAESAEISVIDLALKFEDAGIAAIIFTDIARDGLMKGINAESTAALAARLSVPVIASGGVAGMEDLKNLMKLRTEAQAMGGGILGVIAGRALYDGALDLKQAIALLKEEA